MKVTAERIEDCQVVLSVEIEPERVERSMDKAYRKIVGRAILIYWSWDKEHDAIRLARLGRLIH